MSSLINRLRGSKSLTNSPSPNRQIANLGSMPSGSSTHSRQGGISSSHSASVLPDTRPRSGTDPETCLEVFKTHWNQACAIINKKGSTSTNPMVNVRRSAQEEAEAVMRYVDQMVLLLASEEEDGGQGPILQYLLMEDVLEYLLTWILQQGQFVDRLKRHQLQMYEMLLDQASQSLLVHKPIIRPLLKLLSSCRDNPSSDVEMSLILVLHQLSVCLTRNTQILELLFNAGTDHGPARFLMFSILIPYVHREGSIGHQARNALLLIMSLSSRHDHIGQYIADYSDFCPVLATGLSGLYSSLPRKILVPSDDWYQLTDDDVNSTPELVMFLNSLDFCNAVVQVSHPLVKSQLLSFIYNGFLVPVIAPALHQKCTLLKGSMDEVIAATAYLQLFIQRITEPALMNTFLRFIMTEKHDDLVILESLITRINSSSRLCMVSLGLFQTLVSLDCEDVMFELIFRHLIPCSHVMVSQRRAVRDLDLYGKTAEKFLSLKPSCCAVENSDSSAYAVANADTLSISSSSPPSPILERAKPPTLFKRTFSLRSRKPPTPAPVILPVDATPPGSSSPDMIAGSGQGLRLNHYETNYMDYLNTQRRKIHDCYAACQCWTAPYDGIAPPADAVLLPGFTRPVTQHSITDSAKVEENVNIDMADGRNGQSLSLSAREKDLQAQKNIESPEKETATNITSSDSSQRSCPDAQTVNVPMAASKSQLADQSNYAESQTSDTDSALSGSCFNADGTSPPAGHSASRSDSPLNDNFENTDFNAFLLSLKRVKTPVEFCDNIEDSLTEIDSMISELRSIDNTRADSLPSIVDYTSKDPVENSMPVIRPEPVKGAASSLEESKENVPCSESQKSQITEQLCNGSETADKETTADATPTSDKTAIIFSITRQTSTAPSIGLFLSTLLSKLENMMCNTLYVNLLLTGLIARLASYPQPLLRSFLLHHSLVFQPTIKSLFQVLSSVKHRVDCHAHTVENFELFLVEARRYLAWRDENFLALSEVSRGRRDSTVSLPPSLLSGKHGSASEPVREKRGGLLGFFDRHGSVRRRQVNTQPRLQMIEKGSFRYINRAASPSPSVSQSVEANLELIRTKNAVYCAVVLDEFLKELAAISQEHAVLADNLS